MKKELQCTRATRIERIPDWRRANHKPLRLWDGDIGVVQLSDNAMKCKLGMEAHAIALGWKSLTSEKSINESHRLRDNVCRLHITFI